MVGKAILSLKSGQNSFNTHWKTAPVMQAPELKCRRGVFYFVHKYWNGQFVRLAKMCSRETASRTRRLRTRAHDDILTECRKHDNIVYTS